MSGALFLLSFYCRQVHSLAYFLLAGKTNERERIELLRNEVTGPAGSLLSFTLWYLLAQDNLISLSWRLTSSKLMLARHERRENEPPYEREKEERIRLVLYFLSFILSMSRLK